MDEIKPTKICYTVKTNNFEPYFHMGQKIEAVETRDKIGFGKAVLILCHRKLYFGYIYPSQKVGYAALMDGNRQITYVKRYKSQKHYLVIRNEKK